MVYDKVVEIIMLHSILAKNKRLIEQRTYVRNDDTPPNHHQIIHPDSSPFPPTIHLFTNPQLRANFPTPVQENPHKVSLLNSTNPSWNIRPIIEHERDIYFGLLNCLL